MLLRTFFSLLILVAGALSVQAQMNGSLGNDQSSSPRARDFGSPEDEMRARSEIKIAEKEQQENLERAREAAQLGEEIKQAFSRNKMLGTMDLKKLERLEKLARRIRSRAGGEDDDEPLENVPTALAPAFERLADTSNSLCKGVEKTSRMVISANVIERANELIEIIRFIRTNTR